MPRRGITPTPRMTGRRMKNRLCSVRRRRRCTVRRNALPTAWSVCWYVSPARWATQWSPPTCSCCRVPSPPGRQKSPAAGGIRDDQRLHQPAAGEIPPAVWPARFHRRLFGALCAGHLFPPLRQRSQLSDDGSRRPRHGGRGAQLAGDLLPVQAACAPSPERADYRHHRLVASHSPARLFSTELLQTDEWRGLYFFELGWRWCRWPASSR